VRRIVFGYSYRNRFTNQNRMRVLLPITAFIALAYADPAPLTNNNGEK